MDSTQPIVPQADDFTKVAEFPLIVADGIDSEEAWAEHTGFDNRQSKYYAAATEALGLIERNGTQYKLTWEGMVYNKLSEEKRIGFLASRLLGVEVIARTLDAPDGRDEPGLTFEDLCGIVREGSDLSGQTIERRAQTLRSWLRWLSEHTGIVQDVNGTILIKL